MRPTISMTRILAGGTVLALAACGKMPAGNGTANQEAFSDAVPSHQQVGIDVPGGASAIYTRTFDDIAGDVPGGARRVIQDLAALQRASFYTITRDVSVTVNGGVLGLLAVIKTIANSPPSAATDTHRYYGPWTSALEPLSYAFVMDVTDTSDIKFALVARPKAGGSDAAFQPVLTGTYHPVAAHHGNGTLVLDSDAVQALDPQGDHGKGKVSVAWSNAGEPRTVDVSFAGFADHMAGEPLNALYRFRMAADTSGTFEFLLNADIDHDPAKTKKEDAAIVSRWLATGEGRSDVVITGGDLPVSEVHMVQCWDTLFNQSYYTDDRGVQPTEGSPDACAFKSAP